MAQDIGPRIGITGEAEYRRSIQQIIQQQKTLKAEMQAVSTSVDKNSGSIEKNKKMSESLGKQIDLQKQRLAEERKRLTDVSQARDELNRKLAAAKAETGENTKEIASLERALSDANLKVEQSKEKVEKATAQLNRMEAQLRDIPNAAQVVGQSMQNVGNTVSAVGDKIATVGDKLTKTLTVPIVGAFAASTKASLSFEDSMAKVYTIADKSIKPISAMSDEILELSNRTGKGAGELAEAAYQALSASVDTEHAVEFVATAADLAKAGFLETAGAVDVLTTIINAYGYSAADATKIADQLIQTQNDGKTTVDQLAQSMGQVIPTAAALNVPLEQLTAAYAIMTKQGINTANTTTYLNGLFTQLSDNGSTVAKILKTQTGKSFGQLMASGSTLGDVLAILSEAVHDDSAEMLKLLGVTEAAIDQTDGGSEAFLNLWSNVRAGRGALSLVNGGVSEYKDEVNKMLGATGNVAEALETLDTKGAKARRALNQIVNAGIEIGDRFSPYVEKAALVVSDLVAKWDALGPEAQNTIIKVAAITAAVGPVVGIVGRLVSGIGSVITIAGSIIPVIAPIAPAIVAITAAIGGLVAAGVYVAKHWDELKARGQEFIANTKAGWAEFSTGLVRDLNDAWDKVSEKTSAAFNAIKEKFEQNGGGIRGVLVTAVQSYISIWTNAFKSLDDITGGKLSAVVHTVADAIAKIKGLFDFQWTLPKIKLPHFSWSWNDLGMIRVPTISVDWYKKAYSEPVLFKTPTVLQTASGFKGFGDGSGGEVVIGKNMMYAMIRDAVQSGGGNTTFSGDINVTVYGAEGQDTSTLADLVADRIYTQIVQRKAAFG